MTCIIRKDNILCTDSLIFHAGLSSVSIEYTNKIKRNNAGTVAIVFCGNNFEGHILKILETVSNSLIDSELKNEDVTIESSNSDLIKIMKKYIKDNSDFICVFATKLKTYIYRTFDTKPFLYTYNKQDLVYLGTGSDYLCLVDTENKDPVTLMQETLKKVESCNGDIMVFDLNLLTELSL